MYGEAEGASMYDTPSGDGGGGSMYDAPGGSMYGDQPAAAGGFDFAQGSGGDAPARRSPSPDISLGSQML